MKITYYGHKEKIGRCAVNIKEEHANGASVNDILKHIVRHSPDGFQWGYAGSGPSDLALSILVDYCNRFTSESKDIPNKYYQKFKSDFIAHAKDDLNINSEQIKGWLKKQKNA